MEQIPTSRSKKALFVALTALIPFVLLAFLEIGVRLSGTTDGERRVFTEVPGDTDYLALNPAFVARYFRAFVPGVAYTPFQAQRDSSVFRVMVLGGSSAAGFPYRYYNGFPELLAERLSDGLFGRKVEVVNLGMSAVNSYTLRDLAPAIIQQDPDAVVIYAGHNEYYGAFGTGSSEAGPFSSPTLKLAALKLKRFALYTLLERWIAGPPEPPADGRTMMARAVQDATIAFGGTVYQEGIDQFENNLRAALGTFRTADIPVYIGTLASNLADQAPFSDDERALASYEAGRGQLAAGDTVRARESFLSARRFDTIRFRAPDTLNAVIRALAAGPGIVLVDTEASLRAASPGGLESEALFTDHLHPTVEGYGIMAEAFFEAMLQEMSLEARLAAGVYEPLDEVEEAHVDLLISRLTGDYPYNKTDDADTIRQRYQALLEDALAANDADSLAATIIIGRLPYPIALRSGVQLARSRGDSLEALRRYRALLHWQPFNENLHQEAIEFGLPNPNLDDATDRIASLAVRRFNSEYASSALATTRIRRGAPRDGISILGEVLQSDPGNQSAWYNLARAQVMVGDTLAARQSFAGYQQAARGN